jgi:hypothetical protein
MLAHHIKRSRARRIAGSMAHRRYPVSIENPTVPYGYCQCGCGEKTRIADRTWAARGWVKGLPLRYVNGHQGRHARLGTGVSLDESYAVVDCGYVTPCWVWQRATDRKGYGSVGYGGKVRKAHCVFWERAHGPVPEGLQLDHLCRNPSCVNPDHLEPVSGTENVRRGRGTILSRQLVREIRTRIACGDGNREIASDFGVSHVTISAIRHGRLWRDV